MIGGRTRPAMSVIAKAVEEDYRSRLRGMEVWCGNDNWWSVRHGWQRRLIEDVEAISALVVLSDIEAEYRSLRFLSGEDPSARQDTSIRFPSRNLMHHVP